MNKSYSGLSGIFLVCLIVISISILLLNSFLVALLLAVLLGWWINRHPIPHFTAVLLIGGIALRIVIALLLRPPVVSDFKVLRDAALMMKEGDYSFQNWRYFALWAYQTAFVSWEAFWLKLWSSTACLKIVNAVLASGTVCLLYRMVRRWTSESAAQISAVMLTLLPFAATLHTLLSNQIPSAFFLILGLWLLFCDDCDRLKFFRFPLAGLALQCGNLLRGEGIILIVAILAWMVFELVRNPKQWLHLLAGIAALLAVYFLVGRLADFGVRAIGWNSNGLKNNNWAWKFVTGLNSDTAGRYSVDDWSLIAGTFDKNDQMTDATQALQNSLIAERLHRTPLEWKFFFADKFQMLWAKDALHWTFEHLDMTQPVGTITMETLFAWLQSIDRCLFFSSLVLAAVGGFELHRKRESLPAAAYVPHFVFFASFFAFLFIEVQPRYAFLPQLFLFFAAAYGTDWIRRVIAHA